MDSITITITSADILKEVGRLTHFAGIKSEKETGDFERISATDSDNDMLIQFCSLAWSFLALLLNGSLFLV